jgi:hypothetical protein
MIRFAVSQPAARRVHAFGHFRALSRQFLEEVTADLEVQRNQMLELQRRPETRYCELSGFVIIESMSVNP